MTSSGILKYDTLMKYLNYVFCVKLFSVKERCAGGETIQTFGGYRVQQQNSVPGEA